MKLDHLMRGHARILVQIVHVLRDHMADLAGVDQARNGKMTFIRFGADPAGVPEKVRCQASRRASSLCMNVSKSIGFIRLQTPPGLRKSGMPDSVEMPAPVKTTVRAEPARRAARREIADMAALCGVPRTRGKHFRLITLNWPTVDMEAFSHITCDDQLSCTNSRPREATFGPSCQD